VGEIALLCFALLCFERNIPYGVSTLCCLLLYIRLSQNSRICILDGIYGNMEISARNIGVSSHAVEVASNLSALEMKCQFN